MQATVTVQRVISRNEPVASVEPPWGGYADLVATYDVDFVEWPGMVLLRRAETPAIVIDKPVAPGTTAGNLHLVLGDYKIDIPLAVSASLYPPGRVWRLTRIGQRCYLRAPAVVGHERRMSKMPLSLRPVLISGAVATLCALVVVLAVAAFNRPTILIGSPLAFTGNTAPEAGVITSGDATVSRKPDLALLYVGVESKESTAAAAQKDLAAKASKLIARAKSLGIADKDINTSGYSVSPNYVPTSGAIDGYRAAETLQLKWRNVDTTGTALDALVQQGGATQITVSFGLADPKAAQAEARKLAIADARSRAKAMADAAGVKLGRVLRVSDLTISGYPSAGYTIKAADVAVTQVPVGQLDVQITVQVDFAIDA